MTVAVVATSGARKYVGPVLFVPAYLLYSAAMFWSLLTAIPGNEAPAVGSGPIGDAAIDFVGTAPAFLATVVVVTILVQALAVGAAVTRSEARRRLQTLFVYLLPVAVLVAYHVAYAGLPSTPGPYSSPLSGVAFLQGSILAVVLAVYSRPVIPPQAASLRPDRRVDYLTNHLTNWWRSALLVGTGLAVAIGVAAAGTPGSVVTPAHLGPLATVTASGVVLLGLYGLAKFLFVGGSIRTAYEMADQDVGAGQGGFDRE